MSNNFLLLLPEFMVTGLAFVVLTLDFFLRAERKHWLGIVGAVGLLVTLAVTLLTQWDTEGSLYDGLVTIDGYSLFFRSTFLVMGTVVMLSSVEYVRRNLDHPGEYYAIIAFTIVGMMLLASSGELLTAYISLELLSFGLYVLVSLDRYNPKSNEGGTKYILLGALSSALLLFGMSQVFGLLGTTRFDGIAEALAFADEIAPGVVIGLALIVAGLGFKVAAVPFHMWAPDVYEGAPIPITGYLAVASKAAAFALVLKIFAQALMPAAAEWQLVLVVMAVLTMTLGNLVALAQSNIKRLLAYSSIGHVGYLLMGVAALAAIGPDDRVQLQLSHLASNGVMLHIVAYGVSNLAAFLAIAAFYNATGKDDIADLAGAARRSPYLLHGARGVASVPGRTAGVRGLREQVLLVQRGGSAGDAVARRGRDLHQPDLAVLLPASAQADVHRAAACGCQPDKAAAPDRRPSGGAPAGHDISRRLSCPPDGCDTARERRAAGCHALNPVRARGYP